VEPLDISWVNDIVQSINGYGNNIYVGGRFISAGNVSGRNNIALWGY